MSQSKRGFTPESARLVKQGIAQMRDPWIKKSEKWLIGIGMVYALFPFDFLPDFIPVVGLADDLVITGGTVTIAVLRIILRAVTQRVQNTVDGRQPRPPLQ